MPQPKPIVKSVLLTNFEATIYSDENNPVPAISLNPTLTLGNKRDSLITENLTSKLLSFAD